MSNKIPNSKFQIPNSTKGFTLIELLVVIAMIGILSAISIANFRAGEKRKSLVLAAETVINGIRNAQNYTLTAKSILTSSCNLGQAPQYYLMEFTSGKVMNLYGIDKCNAAIKIESYNLPVRTKIAASGYKKNGVNASALQFLFTPPFALTTLSTNTTTYVGPFSSFTNATIKVEYQDSSVSKTITIDGISGKIE